MKYNVLIKLVCENLVYGGIYRRFEGLKRFKYDSTLYFRHIG